MKSDMRKAEEEEKWRKRPTTGSNGNNLKVPAQQSDN